MFRFGQPNNPMVFPLSANYTNDILFKDPNSAELYLTPTAPGADLYRYSLNWGSSWSAWMQYDGKNTTLTPQVWSAQRLKNGLENMSSSISGARKLEAQNISNIQI